MLLKRRETIVFNPSDREHRAAVRAFLKRMAWADSPLRFSYNSAYGSVAEQVQTRLLQWYLEQEEGKLNKGKKISCMSA